MKTILLTIASLLLAVQVAHAEGPEQIEKVVGLNGAFVPGGFDSGSDAFVIVSGIFPNTCYNWNGTEINQTEGSQVIEIQAKALVNQGVGCMRVLVPYQREVYLGKLEAGEYQLRFSNGDGTSFTEKLVIQ